MSRKSREKGASGEREFAKAVNDELGIRLVRNLRQYQQSGHDLIVHPEETGPVAETLDKFAIEAKRYASATHAVVMGWWAQTCVQAQEAGKVPVLAYRVDRQPWRVVLPLSELRDSLTQTDGLDWTAELSLPAFCLLVRENA